MDTQTLHFQLHSEMNGLGEDLRLAKRAARMIERWNERPGVGFPQIFEDPAELEAAYRFFNNPTLGFELVLQPHINQTLCRCEKYSEILSIEDTTCFSFGGDAPRRGLGRINKNNQGFLAHTSLATTPEGIPLGVLGAELFLRAKKKTRKKLSQHRRRMSKDCESHRWLRLAMHVEQEVKIKSSVIHLMDREGDIYDNVATLISKKRRFVIRCAKNRSLVNDVSEGNLLFDSLNDLPIIYREAVTVSGRSESPYPDHRKLYPARDGRLADVEVTATQVTLKRTRNSSAELPPATTLHVVRVLEPSPPKGETKVEWILLTTEPIETEEDIRRIVNYYRKRFLIEEFFKAIKTGCSFESRQLETYHALSNALAMTIPIAWEMLLVRNATREHSDKLAKEWIEPLRLQVLSALSKRYKLTASPTLKDVAYAIAGMGGHLKRNGPPGWLTLRRGLEKLLIYEAAWIEATKRCDQS